MLLPSRIRASFRVSDTRGNPEVPGDAFAGIGHDGPAGQSFGAAPAQQLQGGPGRGQRRSLGLGGAASSKRSPPPSRPPVGYDRRRRGAMALAVGVVNGDGAVGEEDAWGVAKFAASPGYTPRRAARR